MLWVGRCRTMLRSDRSREDHRRVVGMFYITWHDAQKAKLKAPYAADVTKILAADPDMRGWMPKTRFGPTTHTIGASQKRDIS